MSLWDHAAALYARPGVEAACLRLQDGEGQCVPLLLWRLWTIDEGRAIDAGTLERATALARAWTAAAVAPLRRTRRRLKTPFAPVEDAARLALRAQVAASELAAERMLLDALEALTPRKNAVGAGVDRLTALRALGPRGRKPASEAALRTLTGS
ncbi:MAG: TIGR02444 family protein [Caulobacteraceae bacterium]